MLTVLRAQKACCTQCLHFGSLWGTVCSKASFSVGVNEKVSKTHSNHIYHQVNEMRSKKEMSQHLLQQVFYNKDGVVALNKPTGLGSSQPSELRHSLYDFLPSIAENLGYKMLNIISVPEKNTSGITILADEERIRVVDKSLISAKELPQIPNQKFLAVTVGQPLTEEGFDKFAVAAEKKVGAKKGYYEVILRKWANNAVKRGDINYGRIAHKQVDQSEFASLVSLSTWMVRYHAPRTYLSDVLLSPVLGDNKFGPRVASFLGKTISIKPWNAPDTKKLETALLHALNLQNGEEGFIPLHLHLHEVLLPGLVGEGKALTLRAEPPEHFQWTCEQLGLDVPPTEPWSITELDICKYLNQNSPRGNNSSDRSTKNKNKRTTNWNKVDSVR